MPLRFDAPQQVEAKVLHGPLLLRVLGARKIAWVWLVGWWVVGKKKVGNLWIRDFWMSRMFVGKTMGTRLWCLSFSMFVCKKMSPPNGEANLEQKRGAAGKRTANLAEKMCLEDDPFYIFLWDFWHIFRGYLWLVLLIQPTTNLETLGDYVLKRINNVWIFHWDFLKENPAAKGVQKLWL